MRANYHLGFLEILEFSRILWNFQLCVMIARKPEVRGLIHSSSLSQQNNFKRNSHTILPDVIAMRHMYANICGICFNTFEGPPAEASQWPWVRWRLWLRWEERRLQR